MATDGTEIAGPWIDVAGRVKSLLGLARPGNHLRDCRVLFDDLTIRKVNPQIFSHNIQSYLRNTLSGLRLLSWRTTRIMDFCHGSP